MWINEKQTVDGSVSGAIIYEKAKQLFEELGAKAPGTSSGPVKDFVLGCRSGTDYPQNTYISVYARTNRCYNERGSRTNDVRSSIFHPNPFHVLGVHTLPFYYTGRRKCHLTLGVLRVASVK